MFNHLAKRDSQFEILRIVSMLLIVCYHFLIHGLVRIESYSPFSYHYALTNGTSEIAQIFLPFGKMAYIAFLALSMWYLVDTTFKAKRFFSLTFETIFYKIIMGVCAFTLIWRSATGEQLDAFNWISFIFPISGPTTDYIACFLIFYLFTPFLKIIADKVNKNQLIFLIVILGITQFMSNFLFTLFDANHYFSTANHLLLFIFVYFAILFIKRYPTSDFYGKWSKVFCVIIIAGVWAFRYCLALGYFHYSWQYSALFQSFFSANDRLGGSETAFTEVLAGICLFMLFRPKKEFHSLPINVIASPTLAILLVSDDPNLRTYFWDSIIHVGKFADAGPMIILIMLGIAAAIYVTIGIFDVTRKVLLEDKIFNTRFITNLTDKIDSILVPSKK